MSGIKKITLNDIAKKANVSIATVSRVLNGNESVDKNIKDKIKKIVKSNNYNIKKTAKTKKIISIIIPDITNPFFANIVEGIQSTANLYGYHIILSQCKDNKSIYEEYIKGIRDIGLLGCIIIPANDKAEYLTDMVKSSNIPIIFLDRKVRILNINYVGSDNEIGAYNATKYLINLGHTKILYLAGLKNVSTEEERYKGFITALKEENIDFEYDKLYKIADYDFDESYKRVKESVKSKIKFTAIFATSDTMCFGAKKALEESGLLIPKDISLMGYDNIPFSSAIGLTTVSSQVYEMGKNAVLSLFNITNGRVSQPVNIILQSNIIIRNSCKKT